MWCWALAIRTKQARSSDPRFATWAVLARLTIAVWHLTIVTRPTSLGTISFDDRFSDGACTSVIVAGLCAHIIGATWIRIAQILRRITLLAIVCGVTAATISKGLCGIVMAFATI